MALKPALATSAVLLPPRLSQALLRIQFCNGMSFLQGATWTVLGLTTMPARGERLDDLLELARLEADGVAVCWPRHLPLQQLLALRARVMAT